MKRTPRPPVRDHREPWQIEQGKACGCGGSDDMCACQNENPWPRPATDWQARAEAAEAQLAEAKGEVEKWLDEANHQNARAEKAEAECERLAADNARFANLQQGYVEQLRAAAQRNRLPAPPEDQV